MSKILLPNDMDIRDVIANLNSFSSDPTTSRGAGEIIYQSTAGVIKWNSQTTNPKTNPTWSNLGGGVTDHGALTGLTDDDHTQYILVGGSRAMTGNLNMGTNKITGLGTPTADTDAATKGYADALPGTDSTSFTLDQDGAGASTVLNFNTGGTSALSQLDGTVTLDIPEFDRFYIDINGASEYYFNADELAMYGNKISGLGAGANNGDAIRYEQLIGQYLPLSGGTLSGVLDMNSNNVTNVGSIGFGAAPVFTTPDAGTFTFKALTTTILSFTKTLITFAKELAMSGNKITGLGTPTVSTDAATKGYADALPGTNAATFKINQDNAGAEASAIEFDRGSEATAARMHWSEANDRFTFEEVTGSTLAEVRTKQLDVQDQINLDDTTGTVMIKKNDSTGDMELQVASGDSIVFKAV